MRDKDQIKNTGGIMPDMKTEPKRLPWKGWSSAPGERVVAFMESIEDPAGGNEEGVHDIGRGIFFPDHLILEATKECLPPGRLNMSIRESSGYHFLHLCLRVFPASVAEEVAHQMLVDSLPTPTYTPRVYDKNQFK